MAKRPITPGRAELEAEQAKMNKLYYDVLGETGAVEIVEDLVRRFELKTMVKKLPDGSVDQNATMVNCGAYEVLSWIKQRIENGKMAR